jgi:PAS domain S-box-containing protein
VQRIDFRALFEVLPSPHMVLDRAFNFVGVNAAYEKATMRSREELVGRGLFEMFPNTGEAGRRLRDSIQRAFETGQPDTLAFIHYEIPRPDGEGMEDRYWTAVHTPILGADGKTLFVLQNTVDVTQWARLQTAHSLPSGATPGGTELLQRAQEAEAEKQALLEESDNFRRLFDQSTSFMAVLSGPDHVFTYANQAYRRLIGERQLTGMPVATALPEVVEQGFIEMLDGVLASGQQVGLEGARVMLAAPGGGPLRETFLDFVYQPIFDEAGKTVGVFVQGADRTEAFRAAERQRVLLDELNHRVKNTLATVQSIAGQTLRSTPDPAAFREAFEARLMALSTVHELLTATRWDGADLATVIAAETRPFGEGRISLSGPDVHLSAQQALNIALIVHELATNAAKYGALSLPDGRVEASWTFGKPQDGGRPLRLTWTERGGPPVQPPGREGFGSRLIDRTASHELGGVARREFTPQGLEAMLDLRIRTQD